jgi:UDP:flavonoid glycosyltransferase YjiC (YdhE family)
MPIIESLQKNGFEVIIASDGAALRLLQTTYPNLKAIELPSYNISYRSENMFLNMARMLPGILSAVKAENTVICRMVREYGVDIIISDNRYGCYAPECSNIFITHQINIQTGNSITDWVIRKINMARIGRFDRLWIPDVAEEPSLSGLLSHQFGRMKIPVSYLGIVSRLKKCAATEKQGVLFILSGPEPQRSIFERKVMEQVRHLALPVTIVRGEVSGSISKKVEDHITVYNYADSILLNELICRASVIVARSGYSTLMDLAVTDSSALLVPTPGQTEQIYLAAQLDRKGVFVFQEQERFDLKSGIAAAMERKKIEISTENHLDKLVKSLR